MTDTETVPHSNGIDTIAEEDECNKTRPADIEADMREMERRKRVESIMNSRLFREELERIVDCQIRDGGSSNILQQLSDIMGMPAARIGSVFKSSNCVVPINDIRGVEAMGYEKGEKILRCKLAASFRLIDLHGYAQGIGSLITARLNADQELFLVNPYGVLNHEITASSLNKVNMQGQIVEQGTTNFGVNTSQFTLHSVIHAARPDIRCAIYVACNSVVAISALKQGLLPLTRDSALLGELSVHTYTGALNEPEEKDKLLRSLGPVSKVLLLSNHGAICCGETVEEAFYAVTHIVAACEAQLKLLPVGLDNLVVIPEETRKAIYDASRKPPEGVVAAIASTDNKERAQVPKWRVGGAEFEALMRMLDNAGFRTGYIYRNPLVKNDPPKPKNDVEVPPAVSSLGYLIEEEELFKQGIWKKGDFRKGGDRSRWLNSPNVYQKVEVLETGTPDPKKITKWVAEGSPTHSSTPVKIDGALQFVPPNTNPKEFKRIQQQIKDYRRADKISAGPQSHILEGVSWDEANRLKDANVSATGDHVVLMGAASKGIIQRGFQHNATVYKAPYAKNPFDSVTDDELNEYKKTVEKKRHGDYTDTDFSESEALSSLQISEKTKTQPLSPPSQSEIEDTAAEHQVLRIETKQAPKPSQPEVVLSDVKTYNDEYLRFFWNKQREYDSETSDSRLCLFKISDLDSQSEHSIDSVYSIKSLSRCSSPYAVNQRSASLNSNSIYVSLENLVKNYIPHRTTAFFGFRSPVNIPIVTHFHLPMSPTRYLRRSRSTSLSDVFSTEKFMSMSPDGLRRTIRKKLNFEQMLKENKLHRSPQEELEIDFEYLQEFDLDIDTNNNNFERISEECDIHLRNLHSMDNSFCEKLRDIQLSKPTTPDKENKRDDCEELTDIDLLRNLTQQLYKDKETLPVKLDSIDLEILTKMDNQLKIYGSHPELYHKIGEQILSRKNYEDIDMNSPKKSCATQTVTLPSILDTLDRDPRSTQNGSSPYPCSAFPNDESSDTPPTVISNKTLKNRRNRNFVLENIQRVRSKGRTLKPSRFYEISSTKKLDDFKKSPASSEFRKPRRSFLKRCSLQFSTEEEEDNSESITTREKLTLTQSLEDQASCIAELGGKLNAIQRNVIQIVKLQDEFDSARNDMLSSSANDCQQVNNDLIDQTQSDAGCLDMS
ncbi:protein hu-li tai shao isoform X2 [Uranotaenia lowii]|uniref:protein hu-li tai shao isoform X2 n=1 Tax=Uranotaenia lowii TaxID=190385 RepID=UPI00247A3A88|nr:protein hu-li tai shao isoform X2 [Uranotaenia lowii]